MGALEDRQIQLLQARLDLAIGFARLASYFQQTGNTREYKEQLAFAQTHYVGIVKDWEALDAENAAMELREKRRIAEDCLEKLKRGELC